MDPAPLLSRTFFLVGFLLVSPSPGHSKPVRRQTPISVPFLLDCLALSISNSLNKANSHREGTGVSSVLC
jgi:hypothetical protein